MTASRTMVSAITRFIAYFLFALGLVVAIAAGSAIAIDLTQFRYTTI